MLTTLSIYRRHQTPSYDVVPQASEMSAPMDPVLGVSKGPGVSTEQNVHFVDTHPGFLTDTNGQEDPIRDHALVEDASLGEFFSRPVKIASIDWAVGATIHEVINPWSLYFNNPRVVNRIANYRLMRSKLHVKVTVSGNAFHYGRAIVAYNPLHTTDTLTAIRTYTQPDFVGASQRPHIYIDPTNSQGGELILPFFYHENLIDITRARWSHMGELVVSSIQGLKHANGASDEVTINVFAWAEDIRFGVPTQSVPTTITPQSDEILPQSDEYGTGPVSKIAGIVAAAAGMLTKLPVIGRFARSTEIGASATGALATLFGYSRPAALSLVSHRPYNKGSIATTNVPDDIFKLTIDAKQELSIDPTLAGLGSIDELTINYIAGKESYLYTFDWNVGTPSETLLFNTAVDPCVKRAVGFDANRELHFPAVCFATIPFKYWRGSLKYRFQVVCSKYHKGRLKIVYDPVEGSATSEYNTAYTTIVDIADTTDFTITVGWGQSTTYREKAPVFLSESALIYHNIIPYNANSVNYGNGVLSVYVVNELTVPNTVTNNDIEVNVFVSACEDYEVAVPDPSDLTTLRLTNANTQVQPQSDEIETERMDSTPHHPALVKEMANTTELDDKTNYVYFGECIRSFRQLIKRYNLYYFFTLNDTSLAPGVDAVFEIIHDSLPTEGGYTASAGDFTDTVGGGTLEYVYCQMTLLKYLTTAFGGWRGSTRWLMDGALGRKAGNGDNDLQMLAGVYHGPNSMTINNAAMVGPLTTPAAKAQYLELTKPVHGHNGIAYTTTAVNSSLAFEVPYYSRYRFTPAKQRTDYSSVRLAMPEYIVQVRGFNPVATAAPVLSSAVAAGEDFTCYMYLGPPVFYRWATYPNS